MAKGMTRAKVYETSDELAGAVAVANIDVRIEGVGDHAELVRFDVVTGRVLDSRPARRIEVMMLSAV